MKLPHRSDPHGDKEGTLLRSQVLDVLVRHGVKIQNTADEPLDASAEIPVRLSTEETEHIVLLGPKVGGLQVKDLARRLGINAFEFYARSDLLDS